MTPFDKLAPEWVRELMTEFNLTPEQAAGIVGNLGFESIGFQTLQEIKPAIPGSKGGYGVAQWTGPRRRAFEAWSAEHGLAPSSEDANYGFLVEELRTTHKSTISALKKASTLSDAVFSVGQTYERPGGTTETHLPGFSGRMKYAELALAGAAGQPAPAAPEPGQSTRPAPKPQRRPRQPDPDKVEEIDVSVDLMPTAVKMVQLLLRGSGVYEGEIDGKFGPQCEEAMREFRAWERGQK